MQKSKQNGPNWCNFHTESQTEAGRRGQKGGYPTLKKGVLVRTLWVRRIHDDFRPDLMVKNPVSTPATLQEYNVLISRNYPDWRLERASRNVFGWGGTVTRGLSGLNDQNSLPYSRDANGKAPEINSERSYGSGNATAYPFSQLLLSGRVAAGEKI